MKPSPLFIVAGLAALLSLATAATAQEQDLPVVDSSTIWTGQVERGTLVQEVRGPGVLERFGRGFHAHVRIAAVQARDVELDQSATVDTRADVLEGTVVHIDDRVDQGTLRIVVRIDSELPDSLRPGLSVDARVRVDTLEDVVWVPRPAFGLPGQTVGLFKLLDDGHAERVPVTFGKSSVDKIVVAEGLAVGDVIILSDMSRYDAADRIRIDD